MRRTTALTFDVGGTLDGPAVPWLPRFEALYRRAGLLDPARGGAPVAVEALRRAFHDADDRLAERHRLAGLSLAETVLLQVADTLANLGRRDDALAAEVAAGFVEDARASLRAAAPVLHDLARRFRLGVVSNFYGNLSDVLAAEGLSDLFAAVIDSGAVGVQKPDRRIFEAACTALGSPPSSVAHVGDSYARDVIGARGAGMQPVWYVGPDGARSPHQVHHDPVPRVERLEEIESVLLVRS